jgi:peptidyl-prolyl cis-trans isomerase A (cyclophilin A)
MKLHRSSAILVGFVIAAAGCEHKNKRDDVGANAATPMGSANATASAGGDMKPEPVEPKPAQPSPNPAPAGDDVRPPVAADLAEYTKDLPGKGPLMATIETSMGTFHCELYGDKTPITVANFVGLATGKKAWMNPRTHQVERGKPFFDGLTFHRVIPGFMIQGGDPLGNGMGGPGYTFSNEIVPDLTIKPGVLAMANAGTQPDGSGTDGSQFFITENGTHTDLNGGYTIFGQCKETDLVKKIASVPRNANDKPNEPVAIKHVTISRG